MLQTVLLLMGEDVFLALIEDERCERELRTTAAHRLAEIWEYRLDRDMAGHAPVLLSLRKARRTLRPIYGTMMGASELTRLTFSVEHAGPSSSQRRCSRARRRRRWRSSSSASVTRSWSTCAA